MQLPNSDWPANILAGTHFQTQENGLMSPDGVCTASVGPTGHETTARMPKFARPGQETENKYYKYFKEENTSLMEKSGPD